MTSGAALTELTLADLSSTQPAELEALVDEIRALPIDDRRTWRDGWGRMAPSGGCTSWTG